MEWWSPLRNCYRVANESTGPFERALARLLMAAYKRRLRAIVKVAPAWVSEEMRRY